MSSFHRVTWGVKPGDRCAEGGARLGPDAGRPGAEFHTHAVAAEKMATNSTGKPANNEGWANDSPLEATSTSRGLPAAYVAGGGEEITRDEVRC